MDREIPIKLRLSTGSPGMVLLIAMFLLVLSNQTLAQGRGSFGRGGGGGGFQPPSPDEMFSRLDANNDGTLSETELRNSFMSRAFRDRDLSGGLTREQFAEEMSGLRERFGRGRGGPGEGDSDRRRDRDGDRRRDGDSSRDNGGSTEQAPVEGTTSTPAPAASGARTAGAATASRPRVTLDLQAELLAGDSDGDGQIGLYEWRRFKGRSLQEFHQLDLNRDGFVTPREYATVHPESLPAAPVATAAAASPSASAASGGDADGDTPSGTAPASAAAPASERAARSAERFFRLLDRNDDGQIEADEWVEGRIQTLFVNDGIDLSEPLTADDFARHYLRLSPND